MALAVSDKASNKQEIIVLAAQVLGRSKARKSVFQEIYFGKKRVKTIGEIARKTDLPRKRVLEEGIKLVKPGLVSQTKVHSETAYAKDDFIASCKDVILRIAGKPSEIAKIPTKRNRGGSRHHVVKVPSNLYTTKMITIDDIDNFRKVRKIAAAGSGPRLAELRIKGLFQKVIGEPGKFTDWGGESNDLFTTRLRMNGKRYCTAFAFKGKGTTGILTPRKMGKNADQIQRLFHTSADVFVVQYCGQIADTVVQQMQDYAIMKSATTGSVVYYGIIDGQDTGRLLTAYSAEWCSADVA